MKKLEIMVVEDSELIAEIMVEMLEQELGHRVSKICRTGLEAVQTIEYLGKKGLAGPDLITMDVEMPDMDGINATRRILALQPGALIIMVTSHSKKDMVVEAVGAGAKGYVLKPIGLDKLRESINSVISRSGRH